jgi:hypothetical protein
MLLKFESSSRRSFELWRTGTLFLNLLNNFEGPNVGFASWEVGPRAACPPKLYAKEGAWG